MSDRSPCAGRLGRRRDHDIPAIATYHPAYLLRNPAAE